jgi:hypothetical protein
MVATIAGFSVVTDLCHGGGQYDAPKMAFLLAESFLNCSSVLN